MNQRLFASFLLSRGEEITAFWCKNGPWFTSFKGYRGAIIEVRVNLDEVKRDEMMA